LAQVLQPLSDNFKSSEFPQVLVGLSEPDDAAVYRLDDGRAIISTTDFFPPVVDTPYEFGAIAAANALSDVYAMGGEPLLAINLVAYPDGLGIDILQEILRGGAEKVRESGAVIAGGHSISDNEPKYGLSVTGVVPVANIIRKAGARPGDKLVLSTPLGTGVITTALKRGLASSAHIESAVNVMSRLNRNAAECARLHGVGAMTDITGFGLAGHGHEMARLSGVDLRLNFEALAWLPGAFAYAQRGIFPDGMERNREYFSRWLSFQESADANNEALLFDPQTSGGLLMSVAAENAANLLDDLRDNGDDAAIIGDVVDGAGNLIVYGA